MLDVKPNVEFELRIHVEFNVLMFIFKLSWSQVQLSYAYMRCLWFHFLVAVEFLARSMKEEGYKKCPGCDEPACAWQLRMPWEVQGRVLDGWCCTVCWVHQTQPNAYLSMSPAWTDRHGGQCAQRIAAFAAHKLHKELIEKTPNGPGHLSFSRDGPCLL